MLTFSQSELAMIRMLLAYQSRYVEWLNVFIGHIFGEVMSGQYGPAGGIDMARAFRNRLNDTSRVPGISKTIDIKVLKSKEGLLLQVNPSIRTMVFDSNSCLLARLLSWMSNGRMLVIKLISAGYGWPLIMSLVFYLPMFSERENSSYRPGLLYRNHFQQRQQGFDQRQTGTGQDRQDEGVS